MNSQSLSLELQCPPIQKAVSRPEDESTTTLNAPISSPTTSSPAARSPSEPLMPSDAESFDAAKEPSSGPQRSKLSPSGKGGKEKRKRSRVNPEQLVHLERFFLADRSPTAIRRKEISEILGMQERQTQIWFQNRRAKAKLQDGRPKNNDHVDPSSLDPISHLASGHHLNIQSLIHEEEPVTVIPCTDLSVGSWRRVASSGNSRDLIAYICEAKQCLTWFIHSVGYGFKMEIDFDTIVDIEFNGATMGSGMISLILSQPPLFYLESTTAPLGDGSVKRYWKQCADWTEGHQATQVLRHELIGPAPQLAHLFTRLRAWTSGPRAGQLSSPFSVSSLASPLTPIDQPLYPTDLTAHRRGSDMDHPGFTSKTNFNPSMSSYAKSLLEPTPQAAPRLRSAPPTAPQTPLSAQMSPSLFSDFSGLDEPQHTLNVSEYRRASAPTVYGASRSYMTQPLAQPVPLSLYQQPRSLSQFPSLQTSHMTYANTSSSTLNLPFLPQTDLASSGQAQPMLSGLVGYPYETDDNTYSQGSFLGLTPCTTKETFAEDTTIVP